ncbi:MAG: XrtA-associated tyrosine autokinase, partial [Massilia sp.]
MSIIEKAASRIDQQRQNAAPTPAASTVADQSDPIVTNPEFIPARQASQDAVRAEPVLTTAPASDAPREELLAGRQSTRRIELDLARMRELGMVTAAGGRTNLLEEFRIIKRPLLKRAFAERGTKENPGNLIMVTSSLPGEGKTYSAINLAMSIAMELDHTVLLVDADVARPSVLRTLGLPAQRGLMDILLDDTLDLSDVMLRTNVDTLSILPAGTSTPRATELLASSTMTAMVHELAHRYPDRVIIFDSPPLMLTSESRVLASHMGQIVVV